MAVLAVMIWLWGASSSSVKYEPFGLIFVELGCCHTAEERRELWILFVIKVDQWLLSGLAQVWLQFYFLQFMAVCEIGSNNTMDELSHSNSGCVWRFVMKRWWGHIRAEINTSIRSPVITSWGRAARNKYREQTLCDDVMWCDIWPTVAQALNVGRAMLWLCPGPTKKVYSYWPPTIGLETIPALNANINKNLKLIFLVRQRDRGLCCLQHTWDI